MKCLDLRHQHSRLLYQVAKAVFPSQVILVIRIQESYHGAMLLAVHISDGVLQPGWVAAGWLCAALLAGLGAWRLREDDIPHIALLTAAFFVASSIHVPIGPVRGHLLLNGLLGVVLGRRAGLAILVGLLMQAALIGHGGYTTIGVTCCVMTLPAFAAWGLFRWLRGLRGTWVRPTLVAGSVITWIVSLAYSIAWLSANGLSRDGGDLATPARQIFNPVVLGGIMMCGLLAVRVEARLENQAEFPLGLLLGELTVLLTVVLNSLVLVLGGESDWRVVAIVLLIAHLPIALVEGIVLGFTVDFLARVKPEMLET